MQLSEHTIKAIEDHANASFPEEMCGLIINGEFFPCKNIHEDPTNHFRICPEDQTKAELHGDIQAVIHSHPWNGRRRVVKPESPSNKDMLEWLVDPSIAWGILATTGEGCTALTWLDDNDIQPLLGRRFIHGVHDCYALARDYYRTEHGILIPNFARKQLWWKETDDLFNTLFDKSGFYEIDGKDLKPGDGILMQHYANVMNHCAIYLGDGMILHQLMTTDFISCREPLQKYATSIAKYVRHKQLNQE